MCVNRDCNLPGAIRNWGGRMPNYPIWKCFVVGSLTTEPTCTFSRNQSTLWSVCVDHDSKALGATSNCIWWGKTPNQPIWKYPQRSQESIFALDSGVGSSWSRFPEDLKLPDHKTKLFRNLSGPVQAGRGSLEGKLMLVLVELGS